jgi:hypothetical protein
VQSRPYSRQELLGEHPACPRPSPTGLLGLLLASIGIYGTVSYIVVLRTREVGIRLHPVLFTRAASAELVEAQGWYESEASGLGRGFRQMGLHVFHYYVRKVKGISKSLKF